MRQRVAFFGLLVAAAALPAALSAEPPGYSGRAAVGVELRSDRGSLTVNGKASFEQRGTLVRLDISSLALTLPSSNAPGNLVPAGGYTIVYDPSTLHYTVWSAARRAYFTGTGSPAPAASPSPTPVPTGSPAPSRPSRSPFEDLKDLKAFSMSVNMVPTKETVDGHPTTAFDFNLQAQGKGEPVVFTGHANFADDLKGTPILLVASLSHGAKSASSGNFRFAVTDVRETAPPESDFSPPEGYKKADGLFDVLVMPAGLTP